MASFSDLSPSHVKMVSLHGDPVLHPKANHLTCCSGWHAQLPAHQLVKELRGAGQIGAASSSSSWRRGSSSRGISRPPDANLL